MLFEFMLVLIVLIVFLIYPYFNNNKITTVSTHSQQISDKIEDLRKLVDIVVNHIQLERAFNSLEEETLKPRQSPILLRSYEIYPSESITRTEDGCIIHLVLWDKKRNTFYDNNTLVYAILHEIAHIIAPENAVHEDPEFEEIESLLLSAANNLGYYNPFLPLPENYPCVLE